uniref:Lipid-binding serum glycoprotein C-terminal domain-containing protein n=1 Tax=Meloidogyne floridensis TaxID=298350 RepID=A0A915PBX2_9BILA
MAAVGFSKILTSFGIIFHLLLFSTSLLISVNAQNVAPVPKELAGEGMGNKAGVRARLSQLGVNYIATFLKDILIQQVLSVTPENEELTVQFNDTKARLTDLVLSVQHGPGPLKTKTEAPSQVNIELPEIAFECKATLADGGTNKKVIFHVNPSTLCQLHLDNKALSISLEGEGGANNIERKAILTELGPELLQQLTCSRIVYVIEERVNQRFALLPSKLNLAQLNNNFIVEDLLKKVEAVRQRQRRAEPPIQTSNENAPVDPDLFASFNVSRADKLLLDYTIIDVRADHRGVEVDSSGEVSLRGRGGTPFGPMPLTLPLLANEENMLQMLVSDFMPNSLLYHGHSIGLFNARVDTKTPHFGSLMRDFKLGYTFGDFPIGKILLASTGLLFCLGDFFPTLRRLHPDHSLALLFSTLQSPVIKFRPQSSGGITFSLVGRIIMSLLEGNSTKTNKMKETEVAQMQINVNAHMKIKLSSTTVRPKITLDKISLKTLTPGILAQEELDRSVLLSKEVLQRMVNDILRGGIPIPVHPLLRLHRPKVKIQERALLLLTNVEFNEPLIRQIVGASLDIKRGVV